MAVISRCVISACRSRAGWLEDLEVFGMTLTLRWLCEPAGIGGLDAGPKGGGD